MTWYHNRRTGFVKAEGQPGYICRGFRPEHGDLIAAAPELLDAAREALNVLADLDRGCADEDEPETPTVRGLRAAIAKAEGKVGDPQCKQ